MRHLNRTTWGLSLLFWASAGIAVAQQYTISTVSGGAPPFTPVPAKNTSIGLPQRVTLDASGNVYFTSLNCVFRLDGSGNLTRIAGNSRAGYAGDGGPAGQAQLNAPAGLALDPSGNIFIADGGNNVIRKITTDGVIHTFAGNGTPGLSGDGDVATNAQLLSPSGVAVDKSGNVYIADTGNSSIREVTTDGNIATFAGRGFRGFSGDGDVPVNATLNIPQDVFVGSNGTIYIADTGNASIRAVAPGMLNGTTENLINTVAGSATLGYAGDGGVATKASLFQAWAITVDGSGNLYIVDHGNDRIRMVNSSGIINTTVGNGTIGYSGDGSAAASAMLNQPTGVAVDSSGNVYIADSWNFRIRKVASSNISTVAGNGAMSYSGDGGPATLAQLNSPQGVGVDKAGNLYIADSGNAVLRQVSKSGAITTIGGSTLKLPAGVAVDQAGNVYVADAQDHRVRKFGTDGSFTTFAGNGNAGYAGDGGPAANAQLNTPVGLAVDGSGNVYIAENGNHVIREVTVGGIINTFAGNGVAGYSGDGAPAAQAMLSFPMGVAVDGSGNVYIADSGNRRIREVSPNGIINTIAGTGVTGFSGDGGLAFNAQITSARGITTDPFGNVFFIDGNRVREIYVGSYIMTIAGNGGTGYSGDGGVATAALLNVPTALTADASGNIYVADSANNAIRLLQPSGTGISLKAITNGASNLPGPIAPGEIVVLYGSGMGPATLQTYQLNSSGLVPTSLAGTSVFFDGIPAPIIYTSSTQVGAVVPFELTEPNIQVFVQYQNQTSPALPIATTLAAPALFTTGESGHGQAVAFNQNQQANSSATPAPVGSMITLYATGLGQTSPPGTDGLPGTASPPAAALPVTVTIGGQSATVQGSASGVPGVVAGLMQVTVQVPASLAANAAAPVTLQVGSASAPSGVTVAISK
ncbi:MAG TPA: hypothetical protein VG096_20995 [Bryobacteraceae bacterium]|nr:hypothetical protein [Bryobacteraceae bacterium]